jgi:hypothetical protein
MGEGIAIRGDAREGFPDAGNPPKVEAHRWSAELPEKPPESFPDFGQVCREAINFRENVNVHCNIFPTFASSP